jgi:anti-sigma factor RsiW
MTLSCERARDLAAELLDGDLPVGLRRQVEEHVATCPTCPELYRAMLAVHRELTRLRTIEAGLDVRQEDG